MSILVTGSSPHTWQFNKSTFYKLREDLRTILYRSILSGRLGRCTPYLVLSTSMKKKHGPDRVCWPTAEIKREGSARPARRDQDQRLG